MVVAHIGAIVEILPLDRLLSLAGPRSNRPLGVHHHILLILLDELQCKIGLVPLLLLQDVLFGKLGAVEGLIEVVVLLYVLLLDLQHVLQHLVVVVLHLLEHLDALGCAVLVALRLSHLVAVEDGAGLADGLCVDC